MQTRLSNGGELALRDSRYAEISVTYSDHTVLINLPHCIDNIIELPGNQLLCSHRHSNRVYLADAESGQRTHSPLLPLHPLTAKALTIEQMVLLENGLVAYSSADEASGGYWVVTFDPRWANAAPDFITLFKYNITCMLALPNNYLAIACNSLASRRQKILIYNMTDFVHKHTIDNLGYRVVEQLALQADNTLLAILSQPEANDTSYRKLINININGEIIALQNLALDSDVKLNNFDTINVGLSSLPLTFLPLEITANISKYLALPDIFALLSTQRLLYSLKNARNLFINNQIFPHHPALNNAVACLLSNDLAELQRLVNIKAISAADIIYALDGAEAELQQTGYYLLQLANKLNYQAALNLFYQQLIKPFYKNNLNNHYEKYQLLLSLQCRQSFTVVKKFVNKELPTYLHSQYLQLAFNNTDAKVTKTVLTQILNNAYGYETGQVRPYITDFFKKLIKGNQLDKVKLFITPLTHHHLKDKLLKQGLLHAIDYGQVDILQLLLEQGAPISYYGNKINPLSHAVDLNQLLCLEKLIQCNHCDTDAITKALATAITNNNVAAVKLLLAKANPNQLMQHPKTLIQMTFLSYAAAQNLREVCETLLSNVMIKVNLSQNSLTALHYACRSYNVDIVKLLLAHQADIYSVDHYGRTAFFIACQKGALNCATLMADHAAALCQLKTNAFYKYQGQTAVHAAAYNGHWHILEFLSKHNVDLFIADNEGNSSLTLALMRGYNYIARWLLAQPQVIVNDSLDTKISNVDSDIKYLIHLKSLMQQWQKLPVKKSAIFFANSNKKLNKRITAAESLYEEILQRKLTLKDTDNYKNHLKKIIDQRVAAAKKNKVFQRKHKL